MIEDQKNRIRDAVRNLLEALNAYGGDVAVQLRSVDITKMADTRRRCVYNADVTFVQRESL